MVLPVVGSFSLWVKVVLSRGEVTVIVIVTCLTYVQLNFDYPDLGYANLNHPNCYQLGHVCQLSMCRSTWSIVLLTANFLSCHNQLCRHSKSEGQLILSLDCMCELDMLA